MVNFEQITNYLRTDPNLAIAFRGDNAQFITNYSKREPLPVVRPDSTIQQLIGILATSHRAVVLDNQTLVNYITQSDLVEYLHINNLLGASGSKSIDELNLATKDVVTIKHTEPVIEAFKKMILQKVSGVAVIDVNNSLIGCVSAHDIRAITNSGELLEHLYEPFSEYRKVMEALKVPTKPQTVKTTGNTSLNQVVDMIIKEKVHRVFVTNDSNNVVGIITLSDVIRGALYNL